MKGEDVRREIGMMTSRTMVTYSNPLGSVGHLRKLQYLFTISINISLLTIAAVCFSFNVAGAQTQETRKVTVTADDGSTVTVQEITIASTKNAECTLTYSNGTSSSSMQVWADDVGIVHLWTQRKSPQDKSTDDTHLLECDERGTIAKYVLDLYDPATFLNANPREKEEGRTMLPALKDPMSPD
jgi:hypothetical protein